MDMLDKQNMEEKTDSFIQLQGNYFIMDSEQLVSKPFRELQLEAVNDAHKKSSMTEKLTTVKNNICEKHFVMAKGRLERQKMTRLKQLHDNANKLRQEVKLFNLDRQRHHVEVKKRLQPDRDYSYDDTVVLNMERRLGANIASGYLDKKLKYPIRLRSINDIRVTPVVKKARECLQQHVTQRTIETTLRASPQRSHTARSTATSIPSALYQRRNSRSAPTTSRPSDQLQTALPNIQQHRSLTSRQEQRPQTKVKFSLKNPPEDQLMSRQMTRANIFNSGISLPQTTQNNDFSEEDDPDEDPDLPDYIDLRELFHGNVTLRQDNSVQLPMSASRSVNNAAATSARRTPGSPPKLTTDMLQLEMDQINSKINTFIKTLSESRGKVNSDEDSDDGFMDSISHKLIKFPSNVFQGHHKEIINLRNTPGKSSKPDPAPPLTTEDQFTSQLLPSEVTDASLTSREEVIEPAKAAQTPRYSWQFIRGHLREREKSDQNTEELVLQALTGIPISNSMHTHVPLHTASRALRHTSTFKMHKIVEKLIQERTRYERLQVEELKKQMVAEEAQPAEGETVAESMEEAKTE
ncbi:hypothetical protein Bpfe_007779 [Biomphalaria pfeifferi]|uniref:Uncharacterized protein n=1 Tax=Biomphalaria pfeifferi TaxID=112525 RepID=A0AAD8BZB5_BIOPF|nr:hypothetical protein Bpfe_007779 [Biomphalaria pfeifferi]